MRTFNNEARGDGRFGRKRSGFTLVELLTVIAIIGMLGAISITTVRGAIRTARENQTRTTVAKIDSAITAIYEKYQYLRFDVDGPNIRAKANARVLKIRDLLRCDMPCSLAEVRTSSQHNATGSSVYTPLQDVYNQELLLASTRTGKTVDEFENVNAELLYLVVTNADPETRATFSDREVADTDGNGLMEFVDGWGKPIRWMRWAPGLVYSDRQSACYAGADGVLPEDADPFDPLQVSNGWFLVPYVYSAGPDGGYGLVPEEFDDVLTMNDPFTYSRTNAASDIPVAGSPDATDLVGPNAYKDNIDNHTLVR